MNMSVEERKSNLNEGLGYGNFNNIAMTASTGFHDPGSTGLTVKNLCASDRTRSPGYSAGTIADFNSATLGADIHPSYSFTNSCWEPRFVANLAHGSYEGLLTQHCIVDGKAIK